LLEVFKKNSLDNIYIHFPVPWDNSPHRRVISKYFLKNANKCLKENTQMKINTKAMLELRTDSDLYYEFSNNLFKKTKQQKMFNVEIDKNKQIDIVSKYEQRWLKQHKNIYTIRAYKIQKNTNKKSDKLCLKNKNTFNFTFNMELKENLSFDKFCSKLPKNAKVFKKKGIVINFLKTYKIDEQSGLIACALGSFDMTSSKYIIIKNKKLQYYQSLLPNSKVNRVTHKKLLCVLKSVIND
jgi:tRNA (guanine-N7-)-methyltransferase